MSEPASTTAFLLLCERYADAAAELARLRERLSEDAARGGADDDPDRAGRADVIEAATIDQRLLLLRILDDAGLSP